MRLQEALGRNRPCRGVAGAAVGNRPIVRPKSPGDLIGNRRGLQPIARMNAQEETRRKECPMAAPDVYAASTWNAQGQVATLESPRGTVVRGHVDRREPSRARVALVLIHEHRVL